MPLGEGGVVAHVRGDVGAVARAHAVCQVLAEEEGAGVYMPVHAGHGDEGVRPLVALDALYVRHPVSDGVHLIEDRHRRVAGRGKGHHVPGPDDVQAVPHRAPPGLVHRLIVRSHGLRPPLLFPILYQYQAECKGGEILFLTDGPSPAIMTSSQVSND